MVMKTKLFLTGMFLMALTAVVNAQTPGGGRGNGQGNGTCQGTAYVDSNKNGVCDNYENRTANVQAKKSNGKNNGNGNGNGCCKRKGKGRNFVDANKNGVCDNYEATNKN